MDNIRKYIIENKIYFIIGGIAVLVYILYKQDKEEFIQEKTGVSNEILEQLKKQKNIQHIIELYKKQISDKKIEDNMKKEMELQSKIEDSKRNNQSQLTKYQQINLDETIKKTKEKIDKTINSVEKQALQQQLLSLQQTYMLKNKSFAF